VQFSVIERFRDGNAGEVHRLAKQEVRVLPASSGYLRSWVEVNPERQSRLMVREDAGVLQQWATRWQDLAELAILPVATLERAAQPIWRVH
jgi:hypothetical protein